MSERRRLDGETPGGPPLPDGRFIRALTTFITGFSYSAASGHARSQGRVFFSNQGPFTFGFHVEHRLETTLLQYDNDDVPTVTVLQDVVPGGVGRVQGLAGNELPIRYPPSFR